MDPKTKEYFEKYGNTYQILGLSPAATKHEIKRAWKKLSNLYHPDKHPGFEESFIKVQHAGEILRDTEMKVKYDEFLVNKLRWNDHIKP